MATPSTAASTAPKASILEKVKPFLVPYYIGVAALLGAITTVFAVVILLLILVVTNFNLLGAIE
jgi:hypothetical protein